MVPALRRIALCALFLPSSLLATTAPTADTVELGTNDFRISDADGTSDSSRGAAPPQVVYAGSLGLVLIV